VRRTSEEFFEQLGPNREAVLRARVVTEVDRDRRLWSGQLSCGPAARSGLCTLAAVSEAIRDVPAESDAVRAAVADARRGVITHLTIAGERVAAIVPESVIEALRAAEDAEDAAEADAAWDEPGKSIPLDELEAEFGH
jgi:hypothetical protein